MIRRLWARVSPASVYRRHAMVSSVTSVGLYAMGLVTGPILARALGPEGRGDVAAIVAPTTVLSWILALGLPTAAAYFVGTVPEEKLLVTATAFGIAVGAPICALLWFLLPAYLSGHSPATLTWARVVLVGMPTSVGMFAALEVRRRLKPGLSWNLWRAAPVAVPGIGTVVLALLGKITLQAVLALTVVAGLLPLLLLVSRLAPHRPLPRPSLATLRLMLPYAWRTALLSTATSVTSRLDQVILVALVSPSELGLYAIAVMVASVTNPLTSGLSSALFGHLRSETSDERAASRFRRSVQIALLLSSGVALLLAIFAPVLLTFAFGARFEPATTPLRLLLPGSVALDVVGVITAKLLSEGRPGEASQAAVLGAAVTVLGLVAVAPRYGIEGAAAVTSAAWILQVLFLIKRGGLGARPSRPEAGALLTGPPPITPVQGA